MSQVGNFFEDFAPGQVIRHALGRTVTDADNIWFTGITRGDLVPAPNIAGR